MDVIFKYTSEEAVEDGILFDITQINPEWEKGLFRYVTTNLLSRGYLQDNNINIPNLVDLLNQSQQIIRDESKGFQEPPEPFYSGEIELPSGANQEIFIELNEHGKYTILLPEDH